MQKESGRKAESFINTTQIIITDDRRYPNESQV